MSLTVSRGLTNAGRWTAVATAVAAHLDALERAKRQKLAPPVAPTGALNAARRFFHYVLQGIELDQSLAANLNGSTAGSADSANAAPVAEATMAGISNLSIAFTVMSTARGPESTKDLETLKTQITALNGTLARLQHVSPPGVPSKDLKALAQFFEELAREGRLERDAAFAWQERPLRSGH